MRALINALMINTTVTELDFGANWIGNLGARSLAYAVKRNASVISLSIEGNRVDDEKKLALADAFTQNAPRNKN